MRFFYDTEFVDNGTTIEPLSIAVVADFDGSELYLARDLSEPCIDGSGQTALERARSDEFVLENVLPLLGGEVMPLGLWRTRLLEFLAPGDSRDVELWGLFPCYDHVLFGNLLGTMADWPKGLPYSTFDVHQERVRTQLPAILVPGSSGEHDALHDARDARELWHICNSWDHVCRTMGGLWGALDLVGLTQQGNAYQETIAGGADPARVIMWNISELALRHGIPSEYQDGTVRAHVEAFLEVWGHAIESGEGRELKRTVSAVNLAQDLPGLTQFAERLAHGVASTTWCTCDENE